MGLLPSRRGGFAKVACNCPKLTSKRGPGGGIALWMGPRMNVPRTLVNANDGWYQDLGYVFGYKEHELTFSSAINLKAALSAAILEPT